MGEELTEGKIMRKSCGLLVGLVLTFGTASLGHAGVVEWEGTLTVSMWAVSKPLPFAHVGTGVATVNGSAGGVWGPHGTPLGFHINTISLHHGLSFTGGNNVPEVLPLTDPENPTLLSLRATGIRLGGTVWSQNQTFNGIGDGPPLGTKNTGIPAGAMKLCILFPGCGSYLPIPFGTQGGGIGVGVGGILTVNTFSKGDGFKLSVWGAPWTIGLASITGVTTETPNGGITTYTITMQGFVHGPASDTSSAAALSGVLQLVTPVVVRSTDTSISVCGPSREGFQTKPGWAEVRLRFIPEPGLLLLLGANLAALVMIGRKRMEP